MNTISPSSEQPSVKRSTTMRTSSRKEDVRAPRARRASLQNTIFLAIATGLLSAGFTLQSVQSSLDGWFLGLGAALGFIIAFLFVISRLFARMQRLVVLGGVVILFLSILIEPTSVLQGFAGVYNSFITTIDIQNQLYILPIPLSGSGSTIGAFLLVLSLAIASSFFFWLFAQNRAITLSVFIPLLAIVFGIYTQTASIPSMIMMGLGMVLFICSHTLHAQLALRQGKKAVASRFLKEDDEESEVHVLSVNYPIAVTLLTASIALICALVCSVEIGQYANANQLRSSTIDSINEARFGSDSLPAGVFVRAANMNEEPEGGYPACLRVEFSSAESATPMYFRGYCGSDYQGNQMSQATYVPYAGEWNGLFSWLDSLGFDTQVQNACFAELNNEEERAGNHAHKTLQLSVENADRRYGYSPYQTKDATGEDALLDIYLRSNGLFGTEKADITWVENSQANELFSPPDWINSLAGLDQEEADFVQAEHTYRAFAESTYTSLDEEMSLLIHTFFYGDDQWDSSKDDLFSIVTRIRTMLDSQCEYTATPQAYNPSRDGDYVTWFLTTEKSGNSSAFATAAVLAFRELGIPARYREGYFLTNDIAQALKSSGQNTVVLSAREAHSWCEVYINGVGWTPIEVTPGFYDKNINSSQTIEVSREVAGESSASDKTGTLGEDSSWDDWIPPELRPFAWIGLILLIVILVLIVLGILETQRRVRIALFERNVRNALAAGQAEVPELSRLLYERLSYVMAGSSLAFDETRPFASQDSICAMVAGMREEEYEHMIELLERERFGQIAINAHEANFIRSCIDRIEKSIWLRSSLWRRLVLRYRRLFSFPLIGEEMPEASASQKPVSKKPTRRKKS